MTTELKKLLIKLKLGKISSKDKERFYESFIQIYDIYDHTIGEIKENIADKYNEVLDATDTRDKELIKSSVFALVKEMHNEFGFSSDLCDEYNNKLQSIFDQALDEIKIEKYIDKIQYIKLTKYTLYIYFKRNTNYDSKEIIDIPYEYMDDILNCKIASAYPSKNRLYPHEILMLAYAPTFIVDKIIFQQFWYYDYNITNPQLIIDKLIDEGFLKVGTVEGALEFEKIPDLKNILKNHQLAVSGNKDVLVKRIIDNVSKEELTKLNLDIHYELTEKGITELTENEYVHYIHKYRIGWHDKDEYAMDIWKMNSITQGQPNYPFQEKL